VVLDEDRGSLPYALIHGEALVACAAWALGESGVDIVDATVAWESVAEAGEDFVLHDSLCPMTPPSFIAACIQQARSSGRAVVGVRPVTDTVKVVEKGLVGDTIDRDTLLAIASPLVVPAALVATLARRPGADLARAVADLAAAGHPVDTLPAPPEGRRVASPDDVRLLDALTDPQR
jgi:2-C-methyl-D-erythritol 4-phosphate cytidylyltransferase